MNERVSNIRKILDNEGVDCLLIDSPYDVLYILEINQSFNYVELNIVLLLSKDEIYLISNPLAVPFIKEFLPQRINLIEAEVSSFKKNHFRYIKEIREIIGSKKFKKIGLTSAQYIDISENCVRMRNPIQLMAAVKDENEIELLRKSSSILKNVYSKLKDKISEGIGEIELRNIIDVELHKEGIERRAFPTKVAFGKKTSNLFPVSTMQTLNKGDIVLIDFGGVYKGYIAEMARTFVYGDAEAKYTEIYDIVSTIYKKVIEFLKPGVVASAVDTLVKDYLNEVGHIQYFYQPLGESTGIIKGGITLAPGSNEILKQGMTFVIEPALYIPDWGGIKIKDTVLITENGAITLT
ncbi:MAG: hypothetical protein B5M53_01510 [Candidatus Cloacimonas sp. 4484_209]|nr:MAG: hypothetical protein B5M53_01510 [Candidatus Cloacimonas sp. 4484_209]